MRRHLALVALLLGLLAVAAPSTFAAGPKQKDNDTHVQLLAINDFHGNLEPPAGSSGRIATSPTASPSMPAAPSTSPRTSSTLAQENPNTVDGRRRRPDRRQPAALGALPRRADDRGDERDGLDVTGVGNHEFDEGRRRAPAHAERRLPSRSTAARTATPFFGVALPVPGRERALRRHADTILPAYEIKKFGNAKIAFIGLTLEGTPLIVTPAGVAGLEFAREVADGQQARHDAPRERGRPRRSSS